MNALLKAAHRATTFFNPAPFVAETRQFDADIASFQRGIEATEYTGLELLQLGNADLETSCVWSPPAADTQPAPLPSREHVPALESIDLRWAS